MKARWFMMAVLLLGPLLAGCSQRNLFSDNDPADSKLKYWGDPNDSAVKTQKTRAQAAGWGFGYPDGMGGSQ